MYLCISFYAGRDFNDTVILREVPAAQTQVVQSIQIFDDEINEWREVFDVSLEVVSNISNAVEYRIQTTLCRIQQSDRKLSCKICMHLMYIHISGLKWYFVLHLMKTQYYSHLSLPHCKTSASAFVFLSAAAWPKIHA